MKAVLFVPCYVDAFLPEVAIATLECSTTRTAAAAASTPATAYS
jgi:hypothetical protein